MTDRPEAEWVELFDTEYEICNNNTKYAIHTVLELNFIHATDFPVYKFWNIIHMLLFCNQLRRMNRREHGEHSIPFD